MFRVLLIGDIVARPGREAVRRVLPRVINEHNVDFVIANVENATHGKGLSKAHYEDLCSMGIHVMTLGNHYQAQPEIKQYLPHTLNLLRPHNLKTPFPGVGTALFTHQGVTIRVTNLMGQAFMNEEVLNPFDELDAIVKNGQPSDLHLVDFHAEATGEKMAFAYAFDGKVSVIVGTHTHIQTADNRILPQGTAYMTDLGMCGPHQSVLGVKKEIIIQRLWKQEKAKHDIDLGDEAHFNALLVTFNDQLHVETTQRLYHVVHWRIDHA